MQVHRISQCFLNLYTHALYSFSQKKTPALMIWLVA